MTEKHLLFVCLGNICRSPSAEAVMKHKIEKEGLGAAESL
jgi:protein-tyrosine phosphatase